ncbi:MAG: hypothetical protein WD768_07465 [Phycisphaeraceae bacterium]
MRQPPTDEEAATMQQRAEEWFEKSIRTQLDMSRPHDFLVIDVETGDFEVAEREQEAAERLRGRRPDARIWCRKVGSPYARRVRNHRGGRRIA